MHRLVLSVDLHLSDPPKTPSSNPSAQNIKMDQKKRSGWRGAAARIRTDGLGDELPDQVLQVHGGGLALHDLHHLAADVADLAGLRVAGLLDLPLALLGEADAEEAQPVAVRRLDVDVGLDQRLPLAHHGAQLVRGEVHAL